MTNRALGGRRPLGTLLAPVAIRLGSDASDRTDAIRRAGSGLLAAGAVNQDYVDAMIERENTVSTYVGEGVAIPHGTLASNDAVAFEALSLVTFPSGVDWNGNDVGVVIGLAAPQNGHIALLSQLAMLLLEPGVAHRLRQATTVDEVYALFDASNEFPE